MASEVFEAQVVLLVRVLPHVATETCFALKGGTAINLFVRDLPRLSVDIDLVYLPIEDRETPLTGIRSALGRIAQKIRKAIPDSVVTDSANAGGTLVLVRQRNAQIKIEVTPVLRGTVHPVELRTVRPIVEGNSALLKSKSFRLPTSTRENWLLHWTDSILGICSTFNTCLPMKGSTKPSTRHFSHTF